MAQALLPPLQPLYQLHQVLVHGLEVADAVAEAAEELVVGERGRRRRIAWCGSVSWCFLLCRCPLSCGAPEHPSDCLFLDLIDRARFILYFLALPFRQCIMKIIVSHESIRQSGEKMVLWWCLRARMVVHSKVFFINFS